MTRIPVHVYECQDCVMTFTVEMAFEDQSGITCPSCWEENLRDVGASEIEIATAETVTT